MHLGKMFRGIVSNDPRVVPLQMRIGAVVLNAGAVEQLVDTLAEALRGSPVHIAKARRQPFSQRLEALRRLVATSDLDPTIQAQLLEVLDQAGPPMEDRNAIAHGPLSMIFRKHDGGAERFVGIAVIDFGGTVGTRSETLGVDAIGEIADKLYAVGNQLDALYTRIQQQR
jgi:hypothetical protein